MANVFLVHYDNGEIHGNNYTRVDKVFGSLESANKYAEEKNLVIKTFVPSVTEEEYVSENWYEDTRMSYAEFIQEEWSDWNHCSTAHYYVTENEVIA